MKLLLAYICFIVGINASFQTSLDDASDNLVPVLKIPGTSLFTGLYYNIGMKSFPKGLVNYSNQKVKNLDGLYIQIIDSDPSKFPFFKPGEKCELINQWAFEPSEQIGFYTLRNKGLLSGLVTTSREEEGDNFVILASAPDFISQISVGGNLRDNALVKPVSVNGNMYQLSFHKNPEGTVAWTENKSLPYYHPLRISEKGSHKPRYRKGGDWYDRTLFEFNPASDVELEGTISHFELTDSSNTILDKYEKHTKRTIVKNITMETTTPGTDSASLEKIDTENAISLTFTENLKAFKSLNIFLSLPALNGSQITTEIIADSSALTKNSIEDKQTKEVVIDLSDAKTSNTTLDLSIVKDALEGVDLPFRALMAVQGKADRLAADRSQDILKGRISPEMTKRALQKAGFKIEGVRKVQDSLLVWVTGKLKGTIVIGTGAIVSEKN